MTSVAYSSIERISSSWGIVPLLYLLADAEGVYTELVG